MADRHVDDIEAELAFHAAETVEALVEQGWTAEAARLEAERRFGDQQRYRRELRRLERMTSREHRRPDMKAIQLRRPHLLARLESIVRDSQVGARMLRKNGTVTAAAVLSLSLAIGACTAAFSLVDALILRRLPVRDPAELVNVVYRRPADVRDITAFNYPLFVQMRDAAHRHVQLFGMSYPGRREAVFDDRGGQTEQIYVQWISGSALSILGVKPALGRMLTPADDQNPGQHPVAVISDDFWSRRFDRDPGAVGRWVEVREKHLQIVGVMAPGFTGVEPGLMTACGCRR